MGKLRPQKVPRYEFVPYIGTHDGVPSTIIRDNATGETIVIIGTRDQHHTVLRSLNIAEHVEDKI